MTQTPTKTQLAPLLTIERVFKATPEKLWRYWTVPELYARWFNPAPGLDLVVRKLDARPGGQVEFDMPQPNGDKNPQSGVFHSLTPYTEIVTGSPDKSFLITVRFTPVDATQTRTTMTVKGIPAEYHQMATQGWGAGFDKLDRQLAFGVDRHRALGQVSDRMVHVERWFKAPPEKVFKAWSDPKLLPKFFWPIGTGKLDKLEFRPGGQLLMSHETQPWTAIWTFVEIVPNKKIVTRDIWPDGSGLEATGTLEFIAENGGTRLKVTHGPFPTKGPYQPEGASAGFSMVADRLAEEIEQPGQGEGFVVERFFNAPVAKVWEMWTTKAGLDKWWKLAANDMGYDFKVAKLDVRVGGGYDIVMSNKAHGELHNHGIYTEVVPNRRLSQSWEFDIFLAPGEKAYPIPITVDFEEIDTMGPGSPKATKMTFTQGPMAKPEFSEGSRQGVISNFVKLAKALE